MNAIIIATWLQMCCFYHIQCVDIANFKVTYYRVVPSAYRYGPNKFAYKDLFYEPTKSAVYRNNVLCDVLRYGSEGVHSLSKVELLSDSLLFESLNIQVSKKLSICDQMLTDAEDRFVISRHNDSCFYMYDGGLIVYELDFDS